MLHRTVREGRQLQHRSFQLSRRHVGIFCDLPFKQNQDILCHLSQPSRALFPLRDAVVGELLGGSQEAVDGRVVAACLEDYLLSC